MISIRKDDLEIIIEHARAEYPLEACGILAGKGNMVERVYKMTNIKNSPVSYEMDPNEQLRCENEIKDAGLKIICIYHSHPNSPAYPSQTDIARVYWPGDPDMLIYPDASYLIFSLASEKVDFKSFRIKDGEIEREEIRII